MHKTLLITVAVVMIVSILAGSSFGIEIRYSVEKQAASSDGALFAAPNQEVDLVETMAGFRNSYRASLVKLEQYYRTIGDDTKRTWAEKELVALDSIPWYRYVTPGDIATGYMTASDSIPEADAIYDEAMKLDDEAKLITIVIDDAKLQRALRKFEEVFQKYPTSDKIDDSVYKAATIYEHFKDYEIAVLYYQRAFEWNPEIDKSPRYRAAKILDYKLRKRKQALALYQESLEKESLGVDLKETVEKRVTDLMTSDEKSGIQDDLKKGKAKKTDDEQ